MTTMNYECDIVISSPTGLTLQLFSCQNTQRYLLSLSVGQMRVSEYESNDVHRYLLYQPSPAPTAPAYQRCAEG